MSKGYISIPDRKLLWVSSGNYCAFPACKQKLTQKEKEGEKTIIGEEAHIKGEKPGAARYETNMTNRERNSYENRILLCPTHHRIIDENEETYPAERLHKMKDEHEKWVSEVLQKEEIDITFAELQVITRFLAAQSSEEGKITVIPLQDKIRKNQLTPKIEDYLKIGLLKVKLVKDYIDQQPDPEFGDRLKQGFVNKYISLKKTEKAGDELFLDLYEFASGSSNKLKGQAAGLAVLTYFFEACEVFEE